MKWRIAFKINVIQQDKGESGDSRDSCGLSLCPHLPSTLSTKTPGFMATLALEWKAEVTSPWLKFLYNQGSSYRETGPSLFHLPFALPGLLATDTSSQILSSLVSIPGARHFPNSPLARLTRFSWAGLLSASRP